MESKDGGCLGVFTKLLFSVGSYMRYTIIQLGGISNNPQQQEHRVCLLWFSFNFSHFLQTYTSMRIVINIAFHLFFPIRILSSYFKFFSYFLFKYLALVCMFCKGKWKGLETTFCLSMSSVFKTHKENGGEQRTWINTVSGHSQAGFFFFFLVFFLPETVPDSCEWSLPSCNQTLLQL